MSARAIGSAQYSVSQGLASDAAYALSSTQDSAITAPVTIHRGQGDVFRSKSRYRIAICGRGWGKSVLAETEILRAASKKNQLIVYVAPSYIQARSILWKSLNRKIPYAYLAPGHAVNEMRMEIKLGNGTEIWLRGSDNLDGLRGTNINFLVLDEYQDQHPETFETLNPNLRTHRDGCLILGTPRGPDHFQRLYHAAAKDPEWACFRYATWAAPHADMRKIRAMLRILPRDAFDQEYAAEFLTVKGAVYKDFSRDKHLRATEIDPNKQIIVGQDYNAENYTAVIGQTWDDANGIRFLGDVVTRDSIFAHCDRLAKWFDIRNIDWRKKVTVVGDASGFYNATASRTKGRSDIVLMREYGFQVTAERKNPAVTERVHSLQRLLLTADGTPHCEIDPSCEELVRSLEGQEWSMHGSPDKRKGFDHATDAAGYLAWHLKPIREFREWRVS